MKIFRISLLMLALFAFSLTANAQVGKQLQQIEIRDMENKPVKIPQFGEKHLLIFYVDPDHHKQNQDFTDYLEDHPIESNNIHAFGVINLKDAPLMPNGIVRSMARKKMNKTGATIYSDPEHLLRDGWGIGEVNNLFTILFIDKNGVLQYLKKGQMTKDEQQELLNLIEKYK